MHERGPKAAKQPTRANQNNKTAEADLTYTQVKFIPGMGLNLSPA